MTRAERSRSNQVNYHFGQAVNSARRALKANRMVAGAELLPELLFIDPSDGAIILATKNPEIRAEVLELLADRGYFVE